MHKLSTYYSPLCLIPSYQLNLLTSYFYPKESANDTDINEFIVNRVGYFPFVSGIMIIIIFTGNAGFDNLFELSKKLYYLTL